VFRWQVLIFGHREVFSEWTLRSATAELSYLCTKSTYPLPLNPELIITKDGSHSLYRRDIDEHYHSVFGAIQESMHIFIHCGFDCLEKQNIQIFEMGFGTGLNAFLTCLRSEETGKEVKYFSIEKYPVTLEKASLLNYSTILIPNSPQIFDSIIKAEWGKEIVLNHFYLNKIHADILEYNIPSGNDLIYFDAFSPEKEPDLWSENIFARLYDSMNDGGIFVTYSAKGEVRRMLISVGFKVEKLKGPPGKLHILRAVK